eukprot:scaffold226103_cov32-Prasinocladus_malaysianus.AAC.1
MCGNPGSNSSESCIILYHGHSSKALMPYVQWKQTQQKDINKNLSAKADSDCAFRITPGRP